MYGLSSRVSACQKAWQAPTPARTARLILYARPPAKEQFQKVPGIPVAAHCVRPLRSACLIIRIIRHGLGKKQPRLPSLSLLHNKRYVNFTQCLSSLYAKNLLKHLFCSPYKGIVSVLRLQPGKKNCRASTLPLRASLILYILTFVACCCQP
jgi:hypothetical protein